MSDIITWLVKFAIEMPGTGLSSQSSRRNPYLPIHKMANDPLFAGERHEASR